MKCTVRRYGAGLPWGRCFARSRPGLRCTEKNHAAYRRRTAHRHPARDLGAWRLIFIYGLAGYGYIITATFLPLLMKNSLGTVDPIQVWAAFGLGAIPSCIYWNRLHLTHGANRAMAANLLMQAIGVILPVIAPNIYGYLGSALLVGGSFMGTVTIAMPAAQRVAHTVRFNLLAFLTAAYGRGANSGAGGVGHIGGAVAFIHSAIAERNRGVADRRRCLPDLSGRPAQGWLSACRCVAVPFPLLSC